VLVWSEKLRLKSRRLPPRYCPVFVLTQHRSGGTLLSRLLNCHDRLVVWGEHAGFLDKLADAQAQLERWAQELPERSTRELHRYVADGRLADVKFRPWMSPFCPADFIEEWRRVLLSRFTRGLRRNQRWGFKEIRYHRPVLIKFLHELFPQGQFVLLERNIVDLCVSSLLTPWSVSRLLAEGIGHDRGAFLKTVNDELYRALAMRLNWTEGLAMARVQSVIVQYEELVCDMVGHMDRLFQFLHLPVDDRVRARMHAVIGAVAGATPKDVASEDRGYLTASVIRDAVERQLPEVTVQLAQKGIDPTRLIAKPPHDAHTPSFM
jgi:hypothetical protein